MRRLFAVSLMGLTLAGRAMATDVHVGINIGIPAAPPPIVVSSPPPLVVVPGVPTVQYAPNLGVNFFVYGGNYYTYHSGGWFMSPVYNGPWTYVEHVHVPRPLLVVPHRCFHEPPRYVEYRGHPHHPHGMPPGQAKKIYGRDVSWHEHDHEHGHHHGHEDR